MTAMPSGWQHACAEPPAAAGADVLAATGLLHDLGHQVMTVSLLAESLACDEQLPAEARQRAELVRQETTRALGMISGSLPAGQSDAVPDDEQLIDARQLTAQLTQLAAEAHQTTVTLLPGGPAYLKVSPMRLWRVLWNLIGNGARAAGPDGLVEVSITRHDGTVFEVTDDGPGFGDSADGLAGVGLSVVRQLVGESGGRLDVGRAPDGRTRMRAEFGARCDRIALPPMRQRRRAVA